MESVLFAAVYLPLVTCFVFLLLLRPAMLIRPHRKRRGNTAVASELIKDCIGKTCVVSTGSFGGAAVGTVISVEDNWIELKTKKGRRLLNAEYVTNISQRPSKK